MQLPKPLEPVWERLRDVWAYFVLLKNQFVEDGLQQSAAALTYTTLFAIVPVMTVTYSVLAMVPALRSKGDAIQEWLLGVVAPSAGEQVQIYLSEFSRQTTNLTMVGGVFLLVTAVLLLRTIENTFNRIWNVARPRRGVLAILMYWAVLTLGPILLGVGLGLSSYLTSQTLFTDTVELIGGMRTLLAVLPVVLTTILLTLLYVLVPNCQVPYKQGIIGAFVAALLFELAKSGFAMFIKLAPSYQVIYGAFAAVPLFLLWIYVSWVIVLAGAELVKSAVIFAEYRGKVPKFQALMRALYVLWEKQQEGQVLEPLQLRETLQSARVNQWDEHRDLLVELNLVQRTDEDSYVLTRDLRSLSVADLMALTPWSLDLLLQIDATSNVVKPWERMLAQRCQATQAALDDILGLSLEELFTATEADIKE